MTDHPTAEPLDPRLIEEWKQSHGKPEAPYAGTCGWCGSRWPCPTSRLIAEIERLREERDKVRGRDAMHALMVGQAAEGRIEQGVLDAFGGDEALMASMLPFHDWYFDTYDLSVELLDAKPGFAPAADQLAALLALGIHRVYVSYEDSTARLWWRSGELWKDGECSRRERREDVSALLREARAAAIAKAEGR